MNDWWHIEFLVCDERPSLHIKFGRPSCWPELLSRIVNFGNKLSDARALVSKTLWRRLSFHDNCCKFRLMRFSRVSEATNHFCSCCMAYGSCVNLSPASSSGTGMGHRDIARAMYSLCVIVFLGGPLYDSSLRIHFLYLSQPWGLDSKYTFGRATDHQSSWFHVKHHHDRPDSSCNGACESCLFL